MRRIIVIASYVFLVLAFGVAMLSLWLTPSVEGGSAALALLAAITGLLIDRWVSARERRRDLLRALAHETFFNRNTLNLPELSPSNPPPLARSYPRLATVCLDVAMGSGIFTDHGDAELNRRMYDVRQRITEFNQKLDLTEALVYASGEPNAAATLHTGITSSPTTRATIDELQALGTLLVDSYVKETGIGRDTPLFAVEPAR